MEDQTQTSGVPDSTKTEAQPSPAPAEPVVETPKEEPAKGIERFSTKMTEMLHQIMREKKHGLGTMFPLYNQIEEGADLDQETLRVVESARVMMIIAKTQRAKRFLNAYREKKYDPKMVPQLTAENFKNLTEDQRTIFSSEYLAWAVKFTTAYKSKADNMGPQVTLLVRSDWPLRIENEDFAVGIAPRIEND